MNFSVNKKYLWFLPCLLVFVPTAVLGFEFLGVGHFFGCLFLYLAVGIAEELYFRGIIVNILQKQFNVFIVILISTLVFGLGHISVAFTTDSGSEIILSVVNALLFGWLAVELKLLTKNITFIMIFHFLFDFESKFITTVGTPLLIAEIVRGSIMCVFALILLFVIIKQRKESTPETQE